MVLEGLKCSRFSSAVTNGKIKSQKATTTHNSLLGVKIKKSLPANHFGGQTLLCTIDGGAGDKEQMGKGLENPGVG